MFGGGEGVAVVGLYLKVLIFLMKLDFLGIEVGRRYRGYEERYEG